MVPREVLCKALEQKGVCIGYVGAIKDMIDEVMTSVKTQGGVGEDFPKTIGLHQGLALSPYLFTLVLDELNDHM